MSTAKMPPGIFHIMANEAAERFSYYGMRTILVIFMTKYMMDSAGQPDFMSNAEAVEWYHTFMSAVYFFPIIGAVVADLFLGKYMTIMPLSIVYCLGHLTLALFETRMGLGIGLTLIAIGSGGIKPCVSSHLGDQFTDDNQGLISRAYGVFYFCINLGAFVSTLLTPVLLNSYGPSLAFGIPGILMFVATVVFWMGRTRYIAIPPVPFAEYKATLLSKKGLKALGGLGVLYIFVAMFWALYDQTGSSWVLQADKLDRFVDLRMGPLDFDWLAFTLLPSQIQALNPILVMLYIPLFYAVIYPFVGKFAQVTPLRKIGAGFFVTGVSFAIIAYAEELVATGQNPSILWQFWAYVVITAAEVLISITALEFSYTQAPNAMKSFIMGCFLLSVSIGNVVTAAINSFIQNPDGTTILTGPEYFWLFAGIVTVTGIIFIPYSYFYREESYIQDRSKAVSHT